MLRSLKMIWLKTIRKYHTIMICYHDYMACKYAQFGKSSLYHGHMAYNHLSDEIKLNCKIIDMEDLA